MPDWTQYVRQNLRLSGLRIEREAEVTEDLAQQLEDAYADALHRGLSPSEAEAATKKHITDWLALAKQVEHSRHGRESAMSALQNRAEDRDMAKRGHFSLFTELLQDIRFGCRMLRKNPGFAIAAIVVLALGIGANAAVFSWIEGILFRPYPAVSQQERLVAIGGTSRDESAGTPLSWPDFQDLQRSCTVCEALFVSKITGTTLTMGERAERTTGSIVSANYFDAIGVRPMLGRGFLPGEDQGQSAHPVAVISYQLWQARFRGDPQIVGKTQRLNGVIHTIVGVTPKDFYGTFVGWGMNFWVPASMEDIFESGGYKLADRGARWIEAYARLKPGVTFAQSQQEFAAISSRLEAEYPATNRGRAIRPWPLWQTPFNNAGTLLPTLEIMLAVVGFVLLIACANVGNLVLLHSFERRHEMTVRLAIGAARTRLLKQLLTEGLVLSLFGAGGGLLIAYWCRHALILLFPARGGVQMHLPGEIDWRVLALSAGVCVTTTLLTSLFPAYQTSKIDLAQSMKMESVGMVSGRGHAWMRSGLVLMQVALSFVLLVGAGLLIQSLLKVRNASPGFSTRSVQYTTIDLVSAGYTPVRAQTFQDALVERVRALPGVESASFAKMTPLSYVSSASAPIVIDSYQTAPEESPTADYNEVGDEYFVTMGIPLVAGREFTRTDDENAALVVVTNETMAHRYWHDRDPLGQRLRLNGRWMQVVGVVKDSKYSSIREKPTPFLFVPLRQNSLQGSVLNIRTPLSPQNMATAIAREIHTLDSNLAPYEVITMQEQLDRSTSAQMVAVTLVGILCALALVMVVIGLYGVISSAVSQRRRELGLRMALGAGASNLLRLVLSRGLVLTGAGVLFGAVTALLVTRLLGNWLYKVSPRDPVAFGSALAVMVLVSVAACLLPAWRAARTDPMRALRSQ